MEECNVTFSAITNENILYNFYYLRAVVIKGKKLQLSSIKEELTKIQLFCSKCPNLLGHAPLQPISSAVSGPHSFVLFWAEVNLEFPSTPAVCVTFIM